MSSRHKGVSCDACMWSGFRLRRYKCLICYDYDLCGPCFDSGRETGTHSTKHPMQCLLTKSDYELFYGNDHNSNDVAYSYTCPLCGILGHSEGTLIEHVTTSHGDSSDNVSDQLKVICPVCVGLQSNYTTRHKPEFVRHMNMEHHQGSGHPQAPEQNGEPSFERRGQFARRGMPRARENSSNLRGQSSISSSHNGAARGPSTNTSTEQQSHRAIQRRNMLSENMPSDSNTFNINNIEPLGEIISQLRQARSRSGVAMSSHLSQLEMQFAEQLQNHQQGSNRAVAQRLANENPGSMPSIDLLSLLDSGNVLANVEGGSDTEDEPILRVLVQSDPVLSAEQTQRHQQEQRRRVIAENSERTTHSDTVNARSTLDQLIVSAMNNPVALRRLDNNLNNNAGVLSTDMKTTEKKSVDRDETASTTVLKMRDTISLLENLALQNDINYFNDQESGFMPKLIRKQGNVESSTTNNSSQNSSPQSGASPPPKESTVNLDSLTNDLTDSESSSSRRHNESLYLQEVMLSSFLHSMKNLPKEIIDSNYVGGVAESNNSNSTAHVKNTNRRLYYDSDFRH